MARVPLVLVPGLSCDARAWRDVVARLPGVDCLVAEVPARDRIPAMADDLLAALPARFALAGHSLGGRIALEMLRRDPGRVTRLALVDTGFSARPEGEAGVAEREHRYRLLAIARGQGMRAMGAEWSRPMVHPSRLADAALMEDLVAMIARSTPERFAREIEALLARPDATAVLDAIRCPTLVAVGREDAWSGVEPHREMAERIPGSRLAILGGCGHMAPMEKPAEVAALLREILNARDFGGDAPGATKPAPTRARTLVR